MQTDRGFVLHEPAGNWQSTLRVRDVIGLTTSKDILEAVGRGEGPQRMLVTLGYAGWSPGQLEHELSQNAWLTVEARDGIIFETPAGRAPARGDGAARPRLTRGCRTRRGMPERRAHRPRLRFRLKRIGVAVGRAGAAHRASAASGFANSTDVEQLVEEWQPASPGGRPADVREGRAAQDDARRPRTSRAGSSGASGCRWRASTSATPRSKPNRRLKGVKNKAVDSVAAQLILEQYFDRSCLTPRRSASSSRPSSSRASGRRARWSASTPAARGSPSGCTRCSA